MSGFAKSSDELRKTEKNALIAIQTALCTKYASAWKDAGYPMSPPKLESYWRRTQPNIAFLSKCYPLFISYMDSGDSGHLFKPKDVSEYDENINSVEFIDELGDDICRDFLDKSKSQFESFQDQATTIVLSDALVQDKDEKLDKLAQCIAERGYDIWYEFAQSEIKRAKYKMRRKKSLVQWINSASAGAPPENPLDNPHFKYIDGMIDLQDDDSCLLLPYLLTAYTCNTPRSQMSVNRSSRQGNSPLDIIFSSRRIEADEDAEIEREISDNLRTLKKMSRFFSFEGYSLKEEHEYKKKSRPKVLSIAEKGRPFQNFSFVDYVFKAWAVALTECNYKSDDYESDHIVKEAISRIDFAASYKLMLNRLERTASEPYERLFEENADSSKFLNEFRHELDTYLI